MRVIAGSAKGIFLKSVVKSELRPTSQKVKEALFNILGARVPGCTFLDLFAGTGAMGIEALSRGAQKATFIERDRKSAALLRENLTLAGFTGEGTVIEGDVSRKLPLLKNSLFSIVFIDPPYNFVFHQKVLTLLVENDILSKNGSVVIEHYHKQKPAYSDDHFTLVRCEKYGQTELSFMLSK
jgi:16S rRNA (guanine(966)-N(2))-methyltransferase RsmD